MTDIDGIIAGMSEAQKRAVLAFGTDDTTFPGTYATARELGVSGNTLSSLNGLGGVDPVTYLLGPILVTYEDIREGRHWQITSLGLAVRARLEPAMVEVTAAGQTLFDNLLGPVSGYAEWGLPDYRDDALQIIARHRTATLQRVIDLANACVEQGLPLTAMIPMLEDMR